MCGLELFHKSAVYESMRKWPNKVKIKVTPGEKILNMRYLWWKDRHCCFPLQSISDLWQKFKEILGNLSAMYFRFVTVISVTDDEVYF